jgi:hypothetical protein
MLSYSASLSLGMNNEGQPFIGKRVGKEGNAARRIGYRRHQARFVEEAENVCCAI